MINTNNFGSICILYSSFHWNWNMTTPYCNLLIFQKQLNTFHCLQFVCFHRLPPSLCILVSNFWRPRWILLFSITLCVTLLLLVTLPYTFLNIAIINTVSNWGNWWPSMSWLYIICLNICWTSIKKYFNGWYIPSSHEVATHLLAALFAFFNTKNNVVFKEYHLIVYICQSLKDPWIFASKAYCVFSIVTYSLKKNLWFP